MKGLIRRLGRIWATVIGSGSRRVAQPSPSAVSAPILHPEPQPVSQAEIPEKQPTEKLIEKRPVSRYQRTLVVGVDFGTSSTKVIWQDLSENYFELFRWRPDLKGLESV